MENESMAEMEEWQAFSAHLDHALDLDVEQRQLWLNALREQDPLLAERLHGALAVSQRPGYEEFLAGPSPWVPPQWDPGALAGRSVRRYVIRTGNRSRRHGQRVAGASGG